ncbi:MAG: endonuclease [Bacteroidetes bacterium 4572_112]|nr:MAG: endonuclease [Bacteroidetes bacterium 4572_112]
MKLLIIFIGLVFSTFVAAQSGKNGFPEDFDDSQRGFNSMRIVFYNVENLFDPQKDSIKHDESFTPEGNNHWSKYKYWTKQKKIAQVLTSVGGWEMPSIIGLCEVENKHALINLAYHTSLKNSKYAIVHHESEDYRGIDVALLYRKEKFKVIKDTAYNVRFSFDKNSRTRNILHITGIALDTDTLHIFVTHWPSKYGGAFVTIPKRKFVASEIRKYSQQILKKNPYANIIIMGDFNDTPDEVSVTKGLKARSPDNYKEGDLVNLMYPLMSEKIGSHFYAGETGSEWSVLDQMVVSSNLLDKTNLLKVKGNKAHIFSADFLLEKNNKGIIVPNRTFIGMKYHGGFSDHLPVYMDIKIGNKE